MEPRKEIIINEELKTAIKMMAEDNNSKNQNDMIDIQVFKYKRLVINSSANCGFSYSIININILGNRPDD